MQKMSFVALTNSLNNALIIQTVKTSSYQTERKGNDYDKDKTNSP